MCEVTGHRSQVTGPRAGAAEQSSTLSAGPAEPVSTLSAVAEEPQLSPLAEALTSVGDRWTLLIIEALLDGPRRFGDLQSELQKAINFLTKGRHGAALDVLRDILKDLRQSQPGSSKSKDQKK